MAARLTTRVRTRRGGLATVAALAALTALLAACGGSPDGSGVEALPAGTQTTIGPNPTDTATDSGSATGSSGSGHAGHTVKLKKPKPLRAGEQRRTLTMPAAYTPSAPHGQGTDDYRCFLLDPHLTKDAYLTGTFVQPGNASVVHHVILFSVPPAQVDDAEALDATDPEQGWTCFGGSGLSDRSGLDSAPWLGAWAPGGAESVSPKGYGKLLEKGTRVIMQVHYNLLAGPGPDVSSTLLRVAPASASLTPLQTVLLPAPVELPCRPKHSDGPLCSRDASMADVRARFGGVGNTNDLLYFLCGGSPKPSTTTSCDRPIGEPTTIMAAAGHMHLLGRSITIEVNPGTPTARTVLDIPVWDFDNQGAIPVKPIHLDFGDTVRVTCKHVQWLRDVLPAFAGIPDKYVVWGEGTTDEMCLGILTVTRP